MVLNYCSSGLGPLLGVLDVSGGSCDRAKWLTLQPESRVSRSPLLAYPATSGPLLRTSLLKIPLPPNTETFADISPNHSGGVG